MPLVDDNPFMNIIPENLIFRIFQDLDGKVMVQIEGFENVDQAKGWAKGFGIGINISKDIFRNMIPKEGFPDVH